MTINESGGGISVPVIFDGGTGAGTPTLTLEDGSFSRSSGNFFNNDDETYAPTGPSAGVVYLGSSTITFADVGTLDELDTVDTFTLQGTNNTNAKVTAGPTVNSVSTYEVSSESSGFATLNFANKTNFFLDDEEGGNEIDVQATPANVTTTVNGGTGSNVVKVGSQAPAAGGTVAGIQGALVIDNENLASSGTTAVTIDDSGDSAVQSDVTIGTVVNNGETFGQLLGMDTAIPITWDIRDQHGADDVSSVTIDGGSGANTVTVGAAARLRLAAPFANSQQLQRHGCHGGPGNERHQSDRQHRRLAHLLGGGDQKFVRCGKRHHHPVGVTQRSPTPMSAASALRPAPTAPPLPSLPNR